MVSFLQLTFVLLNMALVIRGVGKFVQMTSKRGLRFILLGPNDSFESVLALADVSVATEEIYRARAETQQRCEPRVVVIVFRDVAVGAILRRADAAGRVRQMRIVSLTAVTFRADSLLLRIDPFAI